MGTRGITTIIESEFVIYSKHSSSNTIITRVLNWHNPFENTPFSSILIKVNNFQFWKTANPRQNLTNSHVSDSISLAFYPNGIAALKVNGII